MSQLHSTELKKLLWFRPVRSLMENQNATASTAATESDHATCFVAIELSRWSWVVAVHTPIADKISLHKLRGRDVEGLLALIERTRTKVEKTLGKPTQVISCYEAGYDGFWLHRVLEANGVDNRVIDPASIQVNRRARRAKTDTIDANAMLRALLAYCRGEMKVCSIVRVPSVEEEDVKRTHRERGRLINERVRHVNRIKGLSATQGIYHFNPLRSEGRALSA